MKSVAIGKSIIPATAKSVSGNTSVVLVPDKSACASSSEPGSAEAAGAK